MSVDCCCLDSSVSDDDNKERCVPKDGCDDCSSGTGVGDRFVADVGASFVSDSSC